MWWPVRIRRRTNATKGKAINNTLMVYATGEWRKVSVIAVLMMAMMSKTTTQAMTAARKRFQRRGVRTSVTRNQPIQARGKVYERS